MIQLVNGTKSCTIQSEDLLWILDSSIGERSPVLLQVFTNLYALLMPTRKQKLEALTVCLDVDTKTWNRVVDSLKEKP